MSLNFGTYSDDANPVKIGGTALASSPFSADADVPVTQAPVTQAPVKMGGSRKRKIRSAKSYKWGGAAHKGGRKSKKSKSVKKSYRSKR